MIRAESVATDFDTCRSATGVRPDRIRTLQFLPVFAVGGTERQVVNLAGTLDPSRFELYFGCLRRGGQLLREITEREIPIAEYQIRNVYDVGAWSERLRFARHLKRERIQIVHAYNFYGNVFAIPAARLAGIPVVVASIRDTGGYLTPLQQRAQRFVSRLAVRITANAEAVRQYLIAEGYSAQKIIVIRNGVDLARFPDRRPDGRLRRELSLPPHVPLVAVFARLVPLKGVEYFLQAAAHIASKAPDVRFLVVGDSNPAASAQDAVYRGELERNVERLGLRDRVVFTGFRLDVPELLSEVTVSVLPSVGLEGLSNALLEAMAAGVPVVATTVGGNGEAVQDGVTGLLVPPRDASALARAIYQLLEDPALAARFGAAGRRRVQRFFSMERCARETEDLYVELLAKARQRGAGQVPRSSAS